VCSPFLPDIKYVYIASDMQESLECLTNKSPFCADDKRTIHETGWNETHLAYSTDTIIHGWGVKSWSDPVTEHVIARAWRYFRHMLIYGLCHMQGVNYDLGGYGSFASVLSYHLECASGHRDYKYISSIRATPTKRKNGRKMHLDRSRADHKS
jgi:hypothetical protein